MALLFNTLSRYHRHSNESLASIYQQQANQIENIRQQLYTSSWPLVKEQLAAAWRSYRAWQLGPNVNITHAYSETLRLVDNLLSEENAGNTQTEDDITEEPCSHAGLEPDPADCSYFLQCIVVGENTIKQHRQKCSPDTLFNPASSVCDWPLNVYKVAPSCQPPERKSGNFDAIPVAANGSTTPSANQNREDPLYQTTTTPFSFNLLRPNEGDKDVEWQYRKNGSFDINSTLVFSILICKI